MENIKFCPKCGSELEDEDKFCPGCGTNLEEMSVELNEQDIEQPEVARTGEKSKKLLTLTLVAVLVLAIIGTFIFFLLKGNNEKSDPEPASETDASVQETNAEAEENAEFIFPDSDKEYLTDEEVEPLSADELALARNEIIARHGRIFTDEKYKSYFESKSWYEGTVQPEEFDANYDNELNDIEKANIELIKKYEALVAEDETAVKYYASVLAEYQKAEQNGFAVDGSEYPHVNKNLLTNGGGTLYYTVIDLCDDGVPELFISQRIDDMSSTYDIVDIYGYADGTPQHLNVGIDLGTTPLDQNGTMGDRTHYTICENNMLKESESSGADQNTITYYKLQENSITLFIDDGALQRGNDYYRNSTGLSADPSSKEEYDSIAEKYPPKENIEWLKLSDFVAENNGNEGIDQSTDYKTAYLNLLQIENENPQPVHNYSIFDMNDDSIPELIVSKGDSGDTITLYFYSFDTQSAATYCAGSFYAPLAQCYERPNDPGIAVITKLGTVEACEDILLENKSLTRLTSDDQEEALMHYHSQNELPLYGINDFTPLEG